MFREMRRSKQHLSEEEAIEILRKHTSGVLGVSGDDDYPYTVPVSHVYSDGKLFFHSARKGHKIDGIRRNDKVTFCVIDSDEVIPDKFATQYKSVIVFGRARIVTDDQEKKAALEKIIARFSPGFVKEGQREIERDWDNVYIVEVRIEHMTGKQAKGLLGA